MAYIYWLPALLGYLSVVVFASFKTFQTTQIESSGRACVQIYHDQHEQVAPKILKNLLASYGLEKTKTINIQSYKTGDLNRCGFSFYLGTEKDNVLPRTFLADYFSSRQTVIWMGYNIWQLGDLLEQEMGLRFLRISDSSKEMPEAFFRDILYRGQVFLKSADQNGQVELMPTDLRKFESLAELRHSRTREVIPYIVHSQNRFYVADNPLKTSTGRDAAFVFSNVLGEVLGLQHFSQAQYVFR